MPDGPYARRSARVLLVDADERVLLLEYWWDHEQPELGTAWFTPGGGVHDGEALADAAARELHEETGLAVAPEELGGLVAYTAGYADLSFARGDFRDDFFLLRVGRHETAPAVLEEHEVRGLVGHRWWRVAELRTTDAHVLPLGLAGLLDDLLGGRPVDPARPVRLPWHH